MNAILRKTEAGIQALQAREGGVKLPVRLRSLMLQIDGHKHSDELLQLALSLGNAPEALDKLLEMGLVEIVPGSEIATATSATTYAVSPPPTAAPAPAAETNEADGANLPDLPVSTKLPEPLRLVAGQMRELADKHLGLTAMLLKRRISHADTEQELRQALVALSDALAKATNTARATALLADVAAQLPIIGLNRPQPYRR